MRGHKEWNLTQWAKGRYDKGHSTQDEVGNGDLSRALGEAWGAPDPQSTRTGARFGDMLDVDAYRHSSNVI